jgi:hypothetical protein
MNEISIIPKIVIYGSGVPTSSFSNENGSQIESIWRKGDPYSKNPNALRHENDGCLLGLGESKGDVSEDTEASELDLFLDSFENLIPSINKMKDELTDDFETTLSLVIRLHEDHAPALHFNQRTIALMAQIKCGIDIDIYPL